VNWKKLDSVTFDAYSETKGLAVGDSTSGFAVNDFGITAAIPEPETFAMLLASIGLLGFGINI
jgi:hypothetical protein